jgi:hypothetical protein
MKHTYLYVYHMNYSIYFLPMNCDDEPSSERVTSLRSLLAENVD